MTDDKRREAAIVRALQDHHEGPYTDDEFDALSTGFLHGEKYGAAHADSGEESQYEITLANALRDARQALAEVQEYAELLREHGEPHSADQWIASALLDILDKVEGGSDAN